MALTKDKKNQIIADITSLLESSKLTVVATYQGTPVKAMQTLRKQAGDKGTRVQVFKNRLVVKAMQACQLTKDTGTDALTGMLLYAFNPDDEVAPAQVLAEFAKTQPSIKFVGAISADGKFLSAEEVESLATLPSKPELIAQVIATLASPLHDVANALAGNLHGLLDGVEAKATA